MLFFAFLNCQEITFEREGSSWTCKKERRRRLLCYIIIIASQIIWCSKSSFGLPHYSALFTHAALTERDFSGLPGGFVAVLVMPSGVTALCYNYNLIVIGGDPLFNGLPWRLDWLEGLARLENYDPALLRRIQRHIKFRIPDASMRRELFALHLPNPDRVQANYAVLAELSRGLSGGDILSVCVNSIHVGSTDDDPA
jgi:hypothetical protein